MLRVRRLQIGFLVVALVAASVAIWDLVTGGFYFQLLGIRVSSREAYKPFRIALLAAVAVIQLNDSQSAPAAASWNVIVRWARWIALAAAIASMALAVRYGIFAAGGADAYGYVSQAELFAAGHLSAPDPLAAVAAIVGPAAAPLGYQRVANARVDRADVSRGPSNHHGRRDSDRRSDGRVLRHSVVCRRQRVAHVLAGRANRRCSRRPHRRRSGDLQSDLRLSVARADERCARDGVVAACVVPRACLPAAGRHWARGCACRLRCSRGRTWLRWPSCSRLSSRARDAAFCVRCSSLPEPFLDVWPWRRSTISGTAARSPPAMAS